MIDSHEGKNTELLLPKGNEFNQLAQMGRNLAHEVNNQLTIITSNTQLMILITKDRDLITYLKAVEDAARDMEKIVRDYQDSSRAFIDSVDKK
jgi:signal transduction histidine kinase